MYQIIKCSNYNDFLAREKEIREQHYSEARKTGHAEILYRGQSNFKWALNPTLFRNVKSPNHGISMVCYFEDLWLYGEKFNPKITRPDISEVEFSERLDQIRKCESIVWPKHWELRDYIIRARHFGYKSPLLDWTRNLHVATYFAYKGIENHSLRISIYMICSSNRDITNQARDGYEVTFQFEDPSISDVERHYLQDALYSIFYENRSSLTRYHFKPYCKKHELIEASPYKLKIFKFNIPSHESNYILDKLSDEYGINSDSLSLTE